MSRFSAGALLLAVAAFAAGPWAHAVGRITDAASAVEAAKRYSKAKCAPKAPCTYKAERDGKQWRVWVRHKEGTLVLYFDAEGNLLRRLEAD